MTIQDVFNKCSELGTFPRVKRLLPIKHIDSEIGQINAIKPHGIAVRFKDAPYDKWFWRHSHGEKDGRKNYMDEIEFI